MDQFPLFVTTAGRSILVVGDGEEAARKLRLVARTTATVDVIAEAPGADLCALCVGTVTLHRRAFAAADVRGRLFVVSAAGSPVDEAVSAAAQAAGVPVNVVDRSDLSTFLMPAIVDRDPVVVAIGSGGAAPVLAKSIRARIESLLPARLGALARFADSFRPAVKGTLPQAARRRFWEWVFAGPVAAAFLGGDEARARSTLIDRLNRAEAAADGPGLVQLVGVGPGDPDLLTFKALRAMQEADVVLIDALVSAEILECVRRDALRIDVGKRKDRHTLPQAEIERLMIDHARAGRRVVRLKGGDPFLFGRGGEEREHLLAAGVPVEVVPGISAAFGCAAATGIPLTHRDHAQGVTFVTGHAKADGGGPDWGGLAAANHTVVVYMGVGTAADTAARLIAAGRAPSTPCAVIENGTRPDQRLIPATLASLGAVVEAAAIAGPALLVIGEVTAAAVAAAAADAPALRAAVL